MKKLCVLPAIALALVGLLFTACPDDVVNGGGGGGGGGSGNVAELEAAIQAAYDAKYGVKEAANAAEVATGRTWVTATELKALDDAIEALEAAKATQTGIDTAKTKLAAATTAFNNAKKQGTAAAITLSGTITVKNNGQTVPYVAITAHDSTWSWQEEFRVSSSAANSSWSIDIVPFSEPTDITFRVQGFNDATYRVDSVFIVAVSDFSVSVHNENVNNVAIDLANLKLITLSGTFNFDYNGKPIPSVVLQVNTNDDWQCLGEVVITQAGNNTPWSLPIRAFDTDTEINISMVGFDTITPWISEKLFEQWPIPNSTWTVRNQNKSGIAINLITLSGTLNVTYDTTHYPYLMIDAVITRGEYESDLYLGNAVIEPATNSASTPWSIIMPAQAVNTNIDFAVTGYKQNDWIMGNGYFYTKVENLVNIKDTNKSGITIKLITLSGPINVTYDNQAVPYVYFDVFGGTNPGIWFGNAVLKAPVANATWLMMIPAFDTVRNIVKFEIGGGPEKDWATKKGWDRDLFVKMVNPSNLSVKDQNVTDITLNLGEQKE